MKRRSKHFFMGLRTNFVTGVLTFLPLFITCYVFVVLMGHTNRLIVSLTPKFFHPYVLDDHYGIFLRLLILLFLAAVMTVIGMLTKNYLGRQILLFWERLINRIPILNKIYQAIHQISNALFGRKSNLFKKVVMVEYPRKGIFSIGFFTGDTKGEIQEKTHEELKNVFIPTTPNPTSGMLVLFPPSEVTVLEMSVEDGMKLIVSGGIVAPHYRVKKGASHAK